MTEPGSRAVVTSPTGTVRAGSVIGTARMCGAPRRLVVELLVLGDELLESGLPGDGRVRDALCPLLQPWLRGCGAEVTGRRLVSDDLGPLREAVRDSRADVVRWAASSGSSSRWAVRCWWSMTMRRSGRNARWPRARRRPNTRSAHWTTAWSRRSRFPDLPGGSRGGVARGRRRRDGRALAGGDRSHRTRRRGTAGPRPPGAVRPVAAKRCPAPPARPSLPPVRCPLRPRGRW
ncbi:molybdopterin-binding protein [Streptomyces sp. NBC_01591]|uniref:molybdopterin-binding protein n=1 Tax=Streptomyces sp. NBC_01591 TaxID=2975888 RepID=UPI002DDBB98A|nr:molybdopterin-binding protein [Streptomyces sp. NBC_01591]